MSYADKIAKKEAEDASRAALAGCVGLILGVTLVIPLIVLMAWNLGVVGITAATGDAIAGINYFTAIGVSCIYVLVRGILKAVNA